MKTIRRSGPCALLPSKNSLRERALRCLLLLCFVHFTGIENGYTYVLADSPLRSGQSISLLGVMLADCRSAFLPGSARDLFGAIVKGRTAVNRLTLRLVSGKGFWGGGSKGFPGRCREPYFRSTGNGSAPSFLHGIQDGQMLARQVRYVKSGRESWLDSDRWQWSAQARQGLLPFCCRREGVSSGPASCRSESRSYIRVRGGVPRRIVYESSDDGEDEAALAMMNGKTVFENRSLERFFYGMEVR